MRTDGRTDRTDALTNRQHWPSLHASDFEKEGAEKAANLKVNLFFHFAKKLEHILQCTDYMHIDDTQLHLFCAHYVYLKLIV